MQFDTASLQAALTFLLKTGTKMFSFCSQQYCFSTQTIAYSIMSMSKIHSNGIIETLQCFGQQDIKSYQV